MARVAEKRLEDLYKGNRLKLVQNNLNYMACFPEESWVAAPSIICQVRLVDKLGALKDNLVTILDDMVRKGLLDVDRNIGTGNIPFYKLEEKGRRLANLVA